MRAEFTSFINDNYRILQHSRWAGAYEFAVLNLYSKTTPAIRSPDVGIGTNITVIVTAYPAIVLRILYGPQVKILKTFFSSIKSQE